MWEYPREGQGIGEIELDQKLIEVDTTNQQPKREQIPQESNEQVLPLAQEQESRLGEAAKKRPYEKEVVAIHLHRG